MSANLETRAELVKLGRLLGQAPESLSYLETIAPAGLLGLREGLTERFFGGHRKLFQRIAASSRLLPLALNVMISEKVFGPVLSARIAGEMPADRAIEMAMKMPLKFLSDVTLELDPKRARDIIRGMPVARVVEVAQELLKRKEYVLMGRFVDFMSDEANQACVNAFKDESVLLEIGKYMEAKHRLKDVLRMLPPARQKKLLVAAAATPQSLRDTQELYVHLDDALRAQLRELVKDQSADVRRLLDAPA